MDMREAMQGLWKSLPLHPDVRDRTPLYIGFSITGKRPPKLDFVTDIEGRRCYIGDTLLFVSDEQEWFKFGLRIKDIKTR
jgi:hypothetical protein